MPCPLQSPTREQASSREGIEQPRAVRSLYVIRFRIVANIEVGVPAMVSTYWLDIRFFRFWSGPLPPPSCSYSLDVEIANGVWVLAQCGKAYWLLALRLLVVFGSTQSKSSESKGGSLLTETMKQSTNFA